MYVYKVCSMLVMVTICTCILALLLVFARDAIRDENRRKRAYKRMRF